MNVYRFKAKLANGKVKKGVVFASNLEQAECEAECFCPGCVSIDVETVINRNNEQDSV